MEEPLTQRKLGEELDEVSLPADLVQEVLAESDACADFVHGMIDDSEGFREEIREELNDSIRELPAGNTFGNTAGVDGSFDIVRSAGVNIAVCSAVSAAKEFEYAKEVFAAPPSQDVPVVCQGVMGMLELKLTAINSADLTIFDGSFTSVLVNLNAMITRESRRSSDSVWSSADDILSRLFLNNTYFTDVLEDTKVVAAPKNATSSEFLENNYDEYAERFSDGAFFTRILQPGEYITFVSKESDMGRTTNLGSAASTYSPPDSDEVVDFFQDKGFLTCYYRPAPWAKAYKLEIPNVLHLENETEKVLRSFGDQIIDPAMIEPYQQWLADAMSKKIVEVTDALKNKVQHRLQDQGHNTNTINSILKGYRTGGNW